MSAPKVLMTTDTAGGVWTFTTELTRELCARGHRVLVAAFGEPQPWQRAEAEGSGAEVQFAGLKLEWMTDPWDDVARGRQWLHRLELEFRPNVMHLNSFGHTRAESRVPTVLTAHSCVTSWWKATRCDQLPDTWWRYGACVREALAKADTVCTPSHAMAADIQDCYQRDSALIRVIWNGRSSYAQASDKEPVVLTAGRLWDEAKNAATLAGIARHLPWPVCLAGPQENEGGHRVEFQGCRELGPLTPSQLGGWLSRAAIFASPARYEPFGYSILEAAQAGCALVLGDIPSLRELWDGAATFVPPNDGTALLHAVRGLIEQPQWLDLMALRARMRSRTFSVSRMADGYEEVYAMTMERAATCAL